MRSQSLRVALSLLGFGASVTASVHAATGSTSPPVTDAKAINNPSFDLPDTIALGCATGSVAGIMKVTNPTSSEVTATASIDGSKDPPVSIKIPAGQWGVVTVRTQAGFANCAAGIPNVTLRGTASGTAVAFTGIYKPHWVTYVQDSPAPSGVTGLFVTRVAGNVTICGSPAKFLVDVKNATGDQADGVKVRLRYGTYDTTVTQKIIVGSTSGFGFTTDYTIDCAAKGAPAVRYDLLSGAGAGGSVSPREVTFKR